MFPNDEVIAGKLALELGGRKVLLVADTGPRWLKGFAETDAIRKDKYWSKLGI